LLEAERGWTVSLEEFEDVGVETSDGRKIAEQDKSTHGNNPVSDRAVDFWKTLSNWVDAANSNELDPVRTSFIIYVSQNKGGKIVSSFSDAQCDQSAKAAIRAARDNLWGPHPQYPLRPTVSAELAPYLCNVFRHRLLCQIVKNFTLRCGSGSPQTDIKNSFLKRLCPPDIIDDVLKHAEGWVKVQTDLLLEQQKPARVTYDEFHMEMTSFIRRHDKRTILTSFAGEPDPQEIERSLLTTYVRQLELINCDYDDKVRAVTDCLRASVDRTKWGTSGVVHADSLNEFEDNLKRTWINTKKSASIVSLDCDDAQKGDCLYRECSKYQARLEGLDVPNHFVPGSFHALADKLEVGWHPDYKNRLAEKDAGGTD
jgi:hypothetical protein